MVTKRRFRLYGLNECAYNRNLMEYEFREVATIENKDGEPSYISGGLLKLSSTHPYVKSRLLIGRTYTLELSEEPE